MEWKIIHIDETDSTNQWIKVHKRDGSLQAKRASSSAFCVLSDYQTAGRGCGTNTWESERGKNLLFSMLIHPTDIPASSQFLVSMVLANSIAMVVSKYVKNVSIKWPNDIYVGDKKICGILIENHEIYRSNTSSMTFN